MHAGSTWYRQDKNESAVAAAYHKLRTQDAYQGQPHGMFSADECFGGRALNRGIELCAVVEQMHGNFDIILNLFLGLFLSSMQPHMPCMRAVWHALFDARAWGMLLGGC